MQLAHFTELLGQLFRRIAQVGVVAQQVVQPRGGTGGDFYAGACTQAQDQRHRHVQPADAPALAFDEHRLRQIHGLQNFGDAGFKRRLRRLGPTRQRAQQRALVGCAVLQVQHLGAGFGQGLQDAGLGAAGGADQHAQVQRRPLLVQKIDHMATPALVAALQLLGVPADQAHPVHHRAAAHAAAPAVDQRLPVRRLVDKAGAQMPGKAFRDHGAAGAPGLEGADLLVQGADDAALIIVQHRAVDRTRNMVEREFGR